MTLEELAEHIKSCTRCQLRENCASPVPGIGSINSKYLLIGEAPGKHEDEAGVPFVGLAGKRLDKLLNVADISLNDCYLTNVVRCRPAQNRDPKKSEIRSCLKWLQEEVNLVRPKYIITLGRIPLSLFSPYGIKQMHGTMFEYTIPSVCADPSGIAVNETRNDAQHNGKPGR